MSDPQVKVFTGNPGNETFFGQTEIIYDNLNPDFSTSFKMTYKFQEKQPLHFEVYDVDGPHKLELCGHVYTTLAEIVGSKN